MVVMTPDQTIAKVVDMTMTKLKPLGFTRASNGLRKIDSGNLAIVQFQKSLANTKSNLRFTINLAIVCGALLDPQHPPLKKAGITYAHLRQRIGMLLPDRQDKWWEITGSQADDALAAEISDLIATTAAPYILRYLDSRELVRLWKNRISPGLTGAQRERYLEELETLTPN